MSRGIESRDIDHHIADEMLDSYKEAVSGLETSYLDNNVIVKSIGKEDRKELAVANIPLAISRATLGYMAYKESGIAISYSDLLQEAMYGLVKGTKKYKPEKGKFSTYVTWWIDREVKRFSQKEYIQPRVSLNQEKENGVELGERLPGVARSPEHQAINSALLDQLCLVLESDLLTLNQSRALKLKYFNGTGKIATQDEIGLIMGISGTRAGQLCRKGIHKIRKAFFSD